MGVEESGCTNTLNPFDKVKRSNWIMIKSKVNPPLVNNCQSFLVI